MSVARSTVKAGAGVHLRQVSIAHVNTVLIQPHWRDDPTAEKNRQT